MHLILVVDGSASIILMHADDICLMKKSPLQKDISLYPEKIISPKNTD